MTKKNASSSEIDLEEIKEPITEEKKKRGRPKKDKPAEPEKKAEEKSPSEPEIIVKQPEPKKEEKILKMDASNIVEPKKKEEKKKSNMGLIVVSLVVLAVAGILLYPTISEWLAERKEKKSDSE